MRRLALVTLSCALLLAPAGHAGAQVAGSTRVGVAIEEMVHIGDRDHNDVKGPQKLGMRAVLFVATRAADRDKTSADAICAHHGELCAIIDRLAG